MSNAISNFERVAYGKESTWGTTPTGVAASQFVRYTGVNSTNEKQTVESGEIANSGEVADIIQVSRRGGVSMNWELSYGNLDDLLESLFANAWSSNVLTVGATRKSITVERQFTDIGRYWTYAGALCQQLTLNLAVGRILTGSIGFMSKGLLEAGSSAFTGGSTVASPTNAVMDPIASLQLAQEGGAGSIAGITDITLNLSRGLVDMPQAGSADPLDLQSGQFVASGSFSCYFADATYIAKHLSHVTSSLAFTLGGASNLKYAFLFNKVKLTIPDIPNGGLNQPLIQQVQWKALRDASNTTCKITRTP
jgi:hypothetical protein